MTTEYIFTPIPRKSDKSSWHFTDHGNGKTIDFCAFNENGHVVFNQTIDIDLARDHWNFHFRDPAKHKLQIIKD